MRRITIASTAWDRLRALRSAGSSLRVYRFTRDGARSQDAYTVEESEDSWELYLGRTAETHGRKIIKAPKRSDEIACYWPTTNESAWIERLLNDGADLLTMALGFPSVPWGTDGTCYGCTLHKDAEGMPHDDGCAWTAGMAAKYSIEERFGG